MSSFEVQVAGLPLRLKSPHEEKTVKELIQIVDSKVEAAMATSSTVTYQKALLLACLHLAEDLVFLKRALGSRLDGLESKAKDVLSELNSTPAGQLTIES